MEFYTAELNHTETTIYALCKVQFQESNRNTNLIGYFIGFILIFFGGILAASSTYGIIMIFAGSWLLLAIGQTPGRRAKKIILKLDGKFTRIDYKFYSEEFVANYGYTEDTIKYKNISILIEDKNYCYLYLISSAVYMFDKSSVTEIDEVKNFLSRRMSLEWRSNKGVFSFSLKDLILIFKAYK